MHKLNIDTQHLQSAGSEEVHTPTENDLLISRLVARIAELEERLYKKELEAPAVAERTPGPAAAAAPASTPGTAFEQQQQQQLQQQQQSASASKLKDSILNTLRESWAKLEAHANQNTLTPAQAFGAAASPIPAALIPTPKGQREGGPAAGEQQQASTPSGAGAGAPPPLRTQSSHGLQPGGNSFQFSTHLVVDYSRPNRSASGTDLAAASAATAAGAATAAAGQGRGNNGGDDDDDDDDDDDNASLSSVDSTGMGYDRAAEAQPTAEEREQLERERQRRQSGGAAGARPSGSGAAGGAGVGGGGLGAEVGGRPPLPPAAARAGRNSSDGGAGAAAAAAGSQLPPPLSPQLTFSQQQQQPQQQQQQSRAAAFTGSVLSKLGIQWGKDKERERDSSTAGGSMPRNASSSSLQQGGAGFGGFGGGGGAGGTGASGSGFQFQYLNQDHRYPQAFTPTGAASPGGTGGGGGGGGGGGWGAFSDRSLEEQALAGGGAFLGMTGGGTGGGGGHYYRYVFDPADVAAEMEVTARVRRAAAEALMEAEAKLAEAKAAQAELQQQVEQAKDLEQELSSLRAERSAIQAAKAALEDDAAAVRRQLEGMKDTEAALQAELESVRSQADIWRSSQGGEADKLKNENGLLRSQLTTRLSELQAARTRLSDGEAERQRLVREAEELQNKIQWLTKINLQLESSAGQLNDARKAAAEWQERFMRERNVRRRLHDQLQQLKGNIRVMTRVRPAQPGQRDIVSYPLEGLLAVSAPDRRYQEFEFDHVFGPPADQAAVFEEAVAGLVRSVADGYNAAILAYGQTGSGKTHTMQGPPDDPGIYVRALRELFRIASEEEGHAAAAAAAASASASASAATSARVSTSGEAAPGGGSEAGGEADAVAVAEAAAKAAAATAAGLGRYSFQVSMLEIYNEAVHDLLAPPPSGPGAEPRALDVSGMGAGELPPGHDRVPGLTWRRVTDTAAVEALLREGGRNRATASTALNAHSSRSHALLSVRVTVTQPDGRRAVSLLHLVDLAGSERVDKSEVTGQQLKEAQSINRSLSALGDVIAALQRRSGHIPFRNSKLTAVLQDSLAGNSKVLLVCNIAPEMTSASETLSSLNFASRAAQVELGTARRAAPSDRASPSPSPYDRSPAPEREDGAAPAPAPPPASTPGGGGGRGRAGPPSGPPLPIMNGTAAKVRAAAAAAGGGGVRSSQNWGGSRT